VVVNDLGGPTASGQSGPGPARRGRDRLGGRGGGRNTEDVTSWEGGRALIDQAVEHFGGLDAVVNNAGSSGTSRSSP